MSPRSAFIADLVMLCASAVAFFAAGQPGWIMLAAGGAVLATRSWARLVVAVFTAAVAVALLVAGGTNALAIVGGILGIVAGLWAAVSGRRWPALGARYERTPEGRLSDWDALDAGIDPTAGSSQERSPESG